MTFLDSRFFENAASKSYLQALRTKLLATLSISKDSDENSQRYEDSAISTEDGEDLGCAICLADTIAQPSLTPCGHVFCRECIDNLFSSRSGKARPQATGTGTTKSILLMNQAHHRPAPCPSCRKEMSYSEVKHVPVPQEGVEINSEEQWKSSTKVQALIDDLDRVEEEARIIITCIPILILKFVEFAGFVN